MIIDKDNAFEIKMTVHSVSAELNESLLNMQHKLSDPEFYKYKHAVGKVMGELYFKILEPIYEIHLELDTSKK